MKLVDIYHVSLGFSPECECPDLERVTLTPPDLMESGTPMCPECETEYFLESWAEINGEVKER